MFPDGLAAEFLQTHKVCKEKIFTAVNAVDNDLFARSAAKARQNVTQLRQELGLPLRYFLYVGRLVREKGIFELVAAYATLEEQLREEVGLVFAGDGSSRRDLEAQAARVSRGVVKFAGFAHRERLAEYYALAEALVLPNLFGYLGFGGERSYGVRIARHLSQAAGCAADLVTEGWNGRIVPVKSVPQLASAMQALGSRPDLCASMGVNSLNRIADYTPQHWSEGIVRMLEATARKHG